MRNIAAFLLALGIAFAGAFCFSSRSSKPVVVSHGGIVDFGKVRIEGADPVEGPYNIELHNRSRKPVRITDVVVSCTCVLIQSNTTEIPPRETVEVAFSLRAPVGPGPRKYTAYVCTDCPTQDVIPIGIACFNALPWFTYPSALEVKLADSEAAAARWIEVRGCPGDPAFVLRKVICAVSGVSVKGFRKMKYLRDESVVWTVDVELSSTDSDLVEGEMAFEVDGGEGVQTRSIPVRIAKTPRWHVVPSALAITGDAVRNAVWHQLRVFGPDTLPPVLGEIKADDILDAEEMPVADESSGRCLRIRVKPGLRPGLYNAGVTVTPRDETRPLEIPILVSWSG